MMDSRIPVWLSRVLALSVVGVLLLGIGQGVWLIRSEMSGKASDGWAALPSLVCTPQGVVRMQVGEADEVRQ